MLAGAVRAQESRRPPSIGWLGVHSDSTAPSVALEGLRAGLRERGWIEGQNLVIEQRSGNFTHAAELAAQLVQAQVSLIVAEGGMIFRILAVSETMPLLFHVNGDPVEAKLVASYARPGGNRTGMTSLSEQLSAKRVELLAQALPTMKKIAAIANQGHPGWPVEHQATTAAARQLGLYLTWLPVYARTDVAPALDSAARSGATGIVAVPDNLLFSMAPAFAEFGARTGLAAISSTASFAEAGNLMSYGPVLRDVYVKLASYADRILRGAKPADLPVEIPDRVELVLNARVARAANIRLPPTLMARADRLIE
jgi:putative tryptophan/tyrosine transport system substrate-binding protein